MHPISAMTASGLRFFSRDTAPKLPTTLSSADWRTTQELSTTTSASWAAAAGVKPNCSSADPSRSESAEFI